MPSSRRRSRPVLRTAAVGAGAAAAGVAALLAGEVQIAKRSIGNSDERPPNPNGVYGDDLEAPSDEMPLLTPEPASAQEWVELAINQNLDLLAGIAVSALGHGHAGLDPQAADQLAGLVGRVAFAVPAGVAWTLPVYELALKLRLLSAAEVTIVTPGVVEPMPKVLPTDVTPEVEASPALSLFARPGDGGIRARRVAILVADDRHTRPDRAALSPCAGAGCRGDPCAPAACCARCRGGGPRGPRTRTTPRCTE